MLKRLMTAAVAAFLLAGCAAAPSYTPAQAARLGAVTDEVQITDIRETGGLDGTLTVAVFARSLVRYRQQLEYRFNWFDAAGMPIRTTVSAPMLRVVDGGQEFNFTATAPGARAVRYTIDIRAEGE